MRFACEWHWLEKLVDWGILHDQTICLGALATCETSSCTSLTLKRRLQRPF
jgi:hypothetical protein